MFIVDMKLLHTHIFRCLCF